MLHKASPIFLWKTRNSCFVEINLPFSKLLNIFKKIQVMGSDFRKFRQFAAIVKIVVLLGKIFHNLQTNNCMTSPVSIPVIILGICEESPVAFYYCTDLTLVVTYKICKDVLRTQSDIYDGALLRQQLTAKRRFFNYFLKNSPSYMFDYVINKPLIGNFVLPRSPSFLESPNLQDRVTSCTNRI